MCRICLCPLCIWNQMPLCLHFEAIQCSFPARHEDLNGFLRYTSCLAGNKLVPSLTKNTAYALYLKQKYNYHSDKILQSFQQFAIPETQCESEKCLFTSKSRAEAFQKRRSVMSECKTLLIWHIYRPNLASYVVWIS